MRGAFLGYQFVRIQKVLQDSLITVSSCIKRYGYYLSGVYFQEISYGHKQCPQL